MKAVLKTTLLLLVLAGFCAPLASAQKLTSKDLISLVKLGFSDAEIQSDIQSSGGVAALSAEDFKALEAAGASPALLEFLRRQSGGGGLDGAALVALVEQRAALGAILDKILKAGEVPALGRADFQALEAAGAPAALVRVLRGGALGAADLARMAGWGLSAADSAKVVAILGVAKTKLAPAQARKLLAAGVPMEVLAALRTGRAGLGGKSAPETPETPETRQPERPVPTPGGVFVHPGRMYTLHYPETWVLRRDIYEDKVRYVVSPEQGEKSVEDLQSGLVVLVDAIDKSTVIGEKDAHALLDFLLPFFLVSEPGLRAVGQVSDCRMGQLSAASIVLEGTLKDKQGTFRARVVMAPVDGMVCTAIALAPVGRYEELRGSFEQILASSSFGHQGFARRGAAHDAEELVKKYKAAVVYVETSLGELGSKGQGSGFIISKKGYILTNWHVVWDNNRDQPGQRFTIHWDDSLHRQPVEAKLLGVQQRFGHAGKTLGGIDVALLKIPAGDYQTVPISPASEVRLGDRILTMGFPKSFDLTGLSMFTTTGALVRFNRSLDGNLESLTIDAKITHGNSGGPCIDLSTGGVVGLNTWGNDEEKDYQGYAFLCPIDAAKARFPLACIGDYDQDPGLDFIDSFEAARTFLAFRGFKDAIKTVAGAVRQRPDSADALALQGLCQEGLGWDSLNDGNQKACQKWLDTAANSYRRALAADGKHAGALIALTSLLLGRNKIDEAATFAERGVQAHPELWITATLAARVALGAKRYEDALRHAAQAKKNSREQLPDPFMVAGDVYYAQKRLEDGHREYQAAARLHPANLAARLGEVSYFERAGRWAEAVEGYRKMLGQFPRHYLVLYRQGLCYLKLGKEKEAGDLLLDASSALKNAGQQGPPDLYLTLADLLAKKDLTVGAVRFYATYLSYYEDRKEVPQVYLKMTKIYTDAKAPELATAHHHMAELYAKKGGTTVPKASFEKAALSVESVAKIIGFEYPLPVVEKLILNNQMDVNVAAAAEQVAKRMGADLAKPADLMQVLAPIAKELKVAPWIARAIYFSNKNYPPKPPTPPNPLVGAWITGGQIPNVGPYQLWVRFFDDGNYYLKMVMAGYPHEEKAPYTIEGSNVYFGSGGNVKQRMFKVIDENTLKIHFAEYNSWAFFKRAPLTPPRWF